MQVESWTVIYFAEYWVHVQNEMCTFLRTTGKWILCMLCTLISVPIDFFMTNFKCMSYLISLTHTCVYLYVDEKIMVTTSHLSLMCTEHKTNYLTLNSITLSPFVAYKNYIGFVLSISIINNRPWFIFNLINGSNLSLFYTLTLISIINSRL